MLRTKAKRGENLSVKGPPNGLKSWAFLKHRAKNLTEVPPKENTDNPEEITLRKEPPLMVIAIQQAVEIHRA